MPHRDTCPHNRETRSGTRGEVRAEGNDVTVSGHAAVFNQTTTIAGLFDERIEPGAFSETLARSDDVVFLVNHDGLPLARTRSGTLRLAEDGIGLKIDSTLDGGDPDVAAIVPKMQRGDLDAMSFAFSADVVEWDDTGVLPLRTIKKATLYDVSIVTMPAYDGTDIGLRSLADHRQAVRQHNFCAARLRLRLKRDLALRVRETG